MPNRHAPPGLEVDMIEVEDGPDVVIWRQAIEMMCRWALARYSAEHPELDKNLPEA